MFSFYVHYGLCMQRVTAALLNTVLSQSRWRIYSAFVSVCRLVHVAAIPHKASSSPSLSLVQCYRPANVRVEKRETAEAETWSTHSASLTHSHTEHAWAFKYSSLPWLVRKQPFLLWFTYCRRHVGSHMYKHLQTWAYTHTHTHAGLQSTQSDCCQEFHSYRIPAQAHILLHNREELQTTIKLIYITWGIKSTGNGTTAGRSSTHFKLAPYWLMEEIHRITLLWKLKTSSYSTSSLNFIMCSIVCVCACVTETHLWKQLSWPRSPLPHPVPAVSNLMWLTALHLSSAPPTFPYLCSARLFFWPPSPPTHRFSPVISFPSTLNHLL